MPGHEQLLTIRTMESTVALVVELRGELDTYTSSQLDAALADGLDRAVDRPVIVDLTGLTFFGSAGIGSLTACSRAATARPGGDPLRLVVDDNHVVTHPLQAAGVGTTMPIYQNLTDALSA